MRVGFIGLGRMGIPMAGNIVAGGFPLTVWNRTRDKAASFAGDVGAEVADTPAELANAVDVLVTMLADGPALKAVYEDAEGVLAGLAEGKTTIDMSTVGPLVVKDLVRQVQAVGADIVDAPVSGSVASAEQRALMIMAGGTQAVVERVRPVLETMGDPVLHVGESGAGATMKLAINDLIYGINQAVSEALVLVERAGLDRSTAYEAFSRSAAAAPVVKYRRPVFEHPGETPVTFTMDLAMKDLELILELARSTGTPMRQAEENMVLFRQASAAGFGDQDMGMTAEFLRGVSGK